MACAGPASGRQRVSMQEHMAIDVSPGPIRPIRLISNYFPHFYPFLEPVLRAPDQQAMLAPAIPSAPQLQPNPEPEGDSDDSTALGTLEFTLLFDEDNSALHCTAHRAKGLKPPATGSVDTYVKANLLPGASKASQLRTRTVRGTREPVWEETLTYHGFTCQDAGRKTLRLCVCEDSRLRRRWRAPPLGELRVPLRKLVPNRARSFDICLEKQKLTKRPKSLDTARGMSLYEEGSDYLWARRSGGNEDDFSAYSTPPEILPRSPFARQEGHLQGWEAGPPAPGNSGGALSSSGAPSFCSVFLGRLKPVRPTEIVAITENPKKSPHQSQNPCPIRPGHILLAERSCDSEHRQWWGASDWTGSEHSLHLQEEMEAEVLGEERGRILLSLCYSSERGGLLVGVLRCAHLAPMDANGYSDPFVRLFLHPSSGKKSKYKTSVRRKTLNPEFNEEFFYAGHREELAQKALLVSVWDYDLGTADDFIGGVQLSGRASGERLRHWRECLGHCDHRLELWHLLDSVPPQLGD